MPRAPAFLVSTRPDLGPNLRTLWVFHIFSRKKKAHTWILSPAPRILNLSLWCTTRKMHIIYVLRATTSLSSFCKMLVLYFFVCSCHFWSMMMISSCSNVVVSGCLMFILMKAASISFKFSRSGTTM